ncbi:MAG: AAA family ATPase, partial [Chloroflexota bacterium]|nr:AAA family ATPase [Chloroflexota bacterium]
MSVKAYRTAEVAERLNVSSHTVRRWIEDGRLAAEHTAGGQARITEGALQEFLRRKQDQPRCQVVAFANQKGGVGKTTSAVAVSAALVDSGQRVCLIDVDPQANATDAVGFDRHRPYPALHDALRAALDGQEAALPLVPLEPGWDLVPSHIDLARMETEIILKAMNKVKILRPLIDPLRAYYDWIILDCGPSL